MHLGSEPTILGEL